MSDKPDKRLDSKSERIHTSPIGEYYMDLLEIDSWIVGRTKSTQATSLLCAKLQERETRIKDRLTYLAEKRGLSVNELWNGIIKGEIKNDEPVGDIL